MYMRIFSFSLVLSNLFKMCPALVFVMVFVFEVVELLISVYVCLCIIYYVLCIIYIFFIKFGKFLAIIYLNIFLSPLQFSDSHAHIFGCGNCPSSLMLCSFIFQAFIFIFYFRSLLLLSLLVQ